MSKHSETTSYRKTRRFFTSNHPPKIVAMNERIPNSLSRIIKVHGFLGDERIFSRSRLVAVIKESPEVATMYRGGNKTIILKFERGQYSILGYSNHPPQPVSIFRHFVAYLRGATDYIRLPEKSGRVFFSTHSQHLSNGAEIEY